MVPLPGKYRWETSSLSSPMPPWILKQQKRSNPILSSRIPRPINLPDPALRKKIRQIIRFSVFLAVGVLLLYFAFRGIDFSEMWQHFKGAKYSWIGLSLVFAIISHLSRAKRWIILIEPLKFRPKLWNTFNATLFGYLSNYALPRAGEVARCVALGR